MIGEPLVVVLTGQVIEYGLFRFQIFGVVKLGLVPTIVILGCEQVQGASQAIASAAALLLAVAGAPDAAPSVQFLATLWQLPEGETEPVSETERPVLVMARAPATQVFPP